MAALSSSRIPPGPGGQSSFLQKRMAKNTKYFDSGDYQVSPMLG